MTVLVTGPTGFVGRRVVDELLDRGMDVRCLVRTPGSEARFDLDRVDVHYGNVTDPASLRAAFHGLETVVHLVAIIREGGSATFQRINVDGAANVARAAAEAGVRRLVHVSAIGAQDNPRLRYLYSKWLGERPIINSGVPYTILRPSLIFGNGDEFLNTLAGLVRVMPVVPIIGDGKNEFQPIRVDDVARCVVGAIDNPSLRNRTVEIGGPQRMTYDELVDAMVAAMGVKRARLHLPVGLVRRPVGLMEKLLSRPPVTRDQLDMLPVPNYTEPDAVQSVFGFAPAPVAGNITFVRRVGWLDGVRMLIGRMPRNIRDH